MRRRSALGVVLAAWLSGIAPAWGSGTALVMGPTDPQTENEWAAWLIGRWAGEMESERGTFSIQQEFRYSRDLRYLITELVIDRGGANEYRGTGVFTYFPDGAWGRWFGAYHDLSEGTAVRDGERMIWTIVAENDPSTPAITRIRSRRSADAYEVSTRRVYPDGRVAQSSERLQRVD